MSISAEQQEQKGSAEPLRKRRFSRFRISLWCLEGVVLLACLEHFVIRPWLQAKRPPAKAAVVQEITNRGEIIRPFAEEARLPVSMRESFPAWYPPQVSLSGDGKAMFELQKMLSEETRLPIETVNSIGMKFRLIPNGNCLIGSPEDEPGHSPVETLHYRDFPAPFYLGMYEVTQAQWETVMGTENNPSHFRGAEQPVEEVSWYDCQEFILKLCALEGLPERAYQLPTEAEWEYACRSGTSSAYCFGNSPEKLGLWADFADNNYKRPNKVGRRLPNALGLFDMHGNLWEWCRDTFQNYPGDFSPSGEVNSWRNIRGGNWHVDAKSCRSANRCRLPGKSVGNMLGFRILRTIDLENLLTTKSTK
ncbi:MAG: formylglycine-generating enzyme family protein [Lentisphaeria bacterium]|nr:formylglycine-generating enzyme family protein [Lentisphaeria bacterium]